MLNLLIGLFIGFVVALLLVNYDDMKRSYQRKKATRRYLKLWKGKPKRGVIISTWEEAFEYRNYPFLLNGQVVGVKRFDWWHCNDESKFLIDINGDKVGTLRSNLICSNKVDDKKWEFFYGLHLSEGYSDYGRAVTLCVVLEVY